MTIELNKTLKEIKENLDSVMEGKTAKDRQLWEKLITNHPADIAFFIEDLGHDDTKWIFKKLPKSLKTTVFVELSQQLKEYCLSFLTNQERSEILKGLSSDELTDLLAAIPDEKMRAYLPLLARDERKKVLSLMKFGPESAGGIMNVDVMTLPKDFSVDSSIRLLQHFSPKRKLHKKIYVVDDKEKLVGNINLEELLFRKGSDKIKNIMEPAKISATVTEDQESVAQKLMHYGVETLPVVDKNGFFLGIVSSDRLLEVVEEEGSEDIYRISAMTPIKQPYFDTPFWRLLFNRSYILIAMLLVQSLTSRILQSFEATLTYFFTCFLTMLVSTGGNTSTQTLAIIIEGIAAGEITAGNFWRFIRREIRMAAAIAILLGGVAFVRVLVASHATILNASIVSLSLGIIVMVSLLLGSSTPIILKKLGLDPALAAGPFLTTAMDVLGVLIYCLTIKFFLS